jgi:hypothetical protein
METLSTNFYHRNGNYPLTNDFQAGGYQLKDIANGVDLTDAASIEQLNTKLNIDGSSVMTGDLLLGDGNTGGNIILQSRNDDYNPQITYRRKDGGDIVSTYIKNGTDYVMSFYDPDSGDPFSPVSSMEFRRTGDIIIEGNILAANDLWAADNISAGASFNVGHNQNGNSAIGFDYTPGTPGNPGTITSAFFFDVTEKQFKVDLTPAEEGYTLWHTGNFNPDDKENHLGNPSELGQYLSSDLSGNRIWTTPVTEFLHLVDTPNDYTGKAGQLIGVNDTEDGIIFGDANPTQTRHTFTGDGTTVEFDIPGGYLPGNVDVYMDRIRQIVAPETNGGDIDASNGTSIIFYTAPAVDSIIEVTAYLKDQFLILPNATENTVGGIKVRIDQATGSVYITTDGTQP